MKKPPKQKPEEDLFGPVREGFEPAEKDLIDVGCRYVAGFDEAGRGALAGPISIGLVIFSPDFFLQDLPEDLQEIGDSKILSEKKRETLYPIIKKHALFAASIHVSSRELDRIGINPATEKALLLALERSVRAGTRPGMVLVDGRYSLLEIKQKGFECRCVIDGDAKIFSIAAASILAKVTRDRRMIRFARYFPGYDLEIHKGYGTLSHRKAMEEKGMTPIHRRSYHLHDHQVDTDSQ